MYEEVRRLQVVCDGENCGRVLRTYLDSDYPTPNKPTLEEFATLAGWAAEHGWARVVKGPDLCDCLFFCPDCTEHHVQVPKRPEDAPDPVVFDEDKDGLAPEEAEEPVPGMDIETALAGLTKLAVVLEGLSALVVANSEPVDPPSAPVGEPMGADEDFDPVDPDEGESVAGCLAETAPPPTDLDTFLARLSSPMVFRLRTQGNPKDN